MMASQAGYPDVAALLSQGMCQTVHWYPEDVPLSRLAGTLVGMANGAGGVILLGVTPRHSEAVGLKDPAAAIERVFQAALLVEPTLVLPAPQQVEVKNGQHEPLKRVLWITIPTGLPNVYSLDGRYLGREGNQTNPLSARRLRQLLVERGVVQFESRVPPEASLEDLDPEQVQAYMDAMADRGVTQPAQETQADFLLRRGCLRRVDGELRPTYAALLLFGRYPQQWQPNASLLAGRFPGSALSDVYIKQDIQGSLPDQLRQAEAFVRANLHSVVRLVGLIHQEAPEYPFEAVRELLVNAIAHRDYNLQGDCIHLNIFADRLEITSPGELPGPVNLENLLEARFARNAVITQVLSDLGFVERLGYGLDRVVASTRQAGLRPPSFEETGGAFRVTLHGALPGRTGNLPDLSSYAGLELNLRQQLALLYLVDHPRLTSHDYQLLCPDVHAETLRRDLVDLVSKGILLKVGDKRATYYILKRISAPED